MTQEEFQKIVLRELGGLKEDVGSLKEDVGGLKKDVNNLKEDVSGLKEDMQDVKARLQHVEQDVGILKEDVGNLKEQVRENTDLLKAVLHSQEFTRAKHEGLEKSTASAQAVQAINERQKIHTGSINLLAARQLQMEVEIDQLKKAQ